MVGDVLAFAHGPDGELEGGEDRFAGGGNVGTRERGGVAGVGEGAGACFASVMRRSRFVGDVVGGAQEAQVPGLGGGGRDGGLGDGLEVLLDGFEYFDAFTAGVGTDAGAGFDAAEKHLLAASAAGDEADAGFDEAHVELGVGLARGGVERYLDAAAEAHAVGRDDDGARAELDGLRHVLEGADGHLDLVPLLFLDGEEELHEVGADGEVGGVAGDDEGLEVGDGFAGGLQGLGDEADDVVAEGVHLGVQFDGGDAVAEVDDGGAGILLDDAVRLLDDGERGDPFGRDDGLVVAGDGVEEEAAGGDGGVVLVPGGIRFAVACRLSEKLFDVGGDGRSGGAHLFGGGADAGGVEHLEGSELPVVAGPHGGVDLDEVVGDFGDAVGAVGEELSEEGPVEGGGFVLGWGRRGEAAGCARACDSTFFAISIAGNLGRMLGL